MHEKAISEESQWRWPLEPVWLQSLHGRAGVLAESCAVGLPTIPRLSSFEIYARYRWERVDAAVRDPMSTLARMISYDTPFKSRRYKEWIIALESAIGYVPCVHADHYYGPDPIDLEAVVEHPIALDAQIMSRRGRAVARRRYWRRWQR